MAQVLLNLVQLQKHIWKIIQISKGKIEIIRKDMHPHICKKLAHKLKKKKTKNTLVRIIQSTNQNMSWAKKLKN